MEHWTEFRSALTVAKLGTVKAAAEELGVHRATVNRHIDTLESHLGVPLFQRHARGYSLTDSGQDMLKVASRADELFTDFAGRCTGLHEKLSGSLKITSLSGIAPLVIPILKEFRQVHSEISLEFLADEQLARLEYGEAHVAIRAGAKPTTPDYVVLPFCKVRFGLYASKDYVNKYGRAFEDQLDRHKFVGPFGEKSRLPYAEWMHTEIPKESFALFASNPQVITEAISQGLGIGCVAEHESAALDLVEIMPPSDAWSVSLWLVTHIDLRRTLKVQEFLRFARDLSLRV